MLAATFRSVSNVRDLSLIRYFAGLGVDLEKQDAAGITALSFAEARSGPVYVEIAELLRSLGATK